MSDHEFEKKVQQKMDDLKLRPSEAVWAEVEKNLRREKRRRRTLLWLPILGALLTAGGYFIYNASGTDGDGSLVNNRSTEKSAPPPVAGAPVSGAAAKPASSSTVKTNEPSSENSTSSGKTEKTATDVAQPAPAIEQPGANETRVNNNREKNSENSEEPTVAIINGKGRQDTNPIPTAPGEKESGNTPASKLPAQKIIGVNKDSIKTQIDSNAVVDNNLKPAVPTGPDRSYYVINSENIKAPLLNFEAFAKLPAKKKYPVASKWQWGITAGGGVSNINEGGLFELLKSVRVEDLTNAAPTYNGIPPAPAPEPSAIEPGAMYSAGAFVQRAISKRLTLSAGLQYSQWSVKTRVGTREDNVRAVNYSNFNSQLVSYSYRADMGLRDYTNRYHFVELPVALSFRFNKSKRTPLVLDGGLSLSRLVYTNALHFDGINRVYFENDDFFRNLQIGLNTGLKIGIMQNTKKPIWVGPNLRYFATGLLKSDISPSGSQHLWSFGINAKMLLKK